MAHLNLCRTLIICSTLLPPEKPFQPLNPVNFKTQQKLTLIYFLHFQIGSLKNYYLFHHQHVQKRSLASNDTHHAALNKEPEVSQSSRRPVMKQLNEPDNDTIFIFMAILEFHDSRVMLNEKLHHFAKDT